MTDHRPAVCAVLLLFIVFAALVFPGDTHAEKDQLRVAYVHMGSISQEGWDRGHELGRQKMMKALGDRVETRTVDQVHPQDSERVMRMLARRGYDVIVASAYDFQDPGIRVAEDFPDVKIIHGSGFKQRDNFAVMDAKMYQARYLAGIVAGIRTETDILGFVAPHPIPIIIRGINAYQLGARSVNPDVVTKVVWTNSWYDPDKGQSAANSLIEQGADVINHQLTSPAPMQAAQNHGVFTFGMHTNMTDFAPKAILGNQIWHWQNYYIPEFRKILNGNWKARRYWGGMEDRMIDLELTDLATPREQEAVREARGKLHREELNVFTGPLADNQGTVKLKDGETMPEQKVKGMDWLVEGIEGSIPN